VNPAAGAVSPVPDMTVIVAPLSGRYVPGGAVTAKAPKTQSWAKSPLTARGVPPQGHAHNGWPRRHKGRRTRLPDSGTRRLLLTQHHRTTSFAKFLSHGSSLPLVIGTVVRGAPVPLYALSCWQVIRGRVAGEGTR